MPTVSSETDPISIHALLAESDAIHRCHEGADTYFYPRSPCGERRWGEKFQERILCISIHALLAESDMMVVRVSMDVAISIHALLAESDGKLPGQHGQLPISIHALLAESDGKSMADMFSSQISIHALLAESDSSRWVRPGYFALFLSTLSLRRATQTAAQGVLQRLEFLSTLSLRRATLWDLTGDLSYDYFYPRSPCGERLPSGSKYSGCSAHFYPRSPCGERRILSTRIIGFSGFLSTLSLRRATFGLISAGFIGG